MYTNAYRRFHQAGCAAITAAAAAATVSVAPQAGYHDDVVPRFEWHAVTLQAAISAAVPVLNPAITPRPAASASLTAEQAAFDLSALEPILRPLLVGLNLVLAPLWFLATPITLPLSFLIPNPAGYGGFGPFPIPFGVAAWAFGPIYAANAVLTAFVPDLGRAITQLLLPPTPATAAQPSPSSATSARPTDGGTEFGQDDSNAPIESTEVTPDPAANTPPQWNTDEPFELALASRQESSPPTSSHEIAPASNATPTQSTATTDIGSPESAGSEDHPANQVSRSSSTTPDKANAARNGQMRAADRDSSRAKR